MKMTNALLAIIALLLFWISLNTTPELNASSNRWTDVNIAAISGRPLYDRQLPVSTK